MERLPRGAAEAVLEFLEDTSRLELNDLYPDELLTRLQGLVPATWVLYQVADDQGRTFVGIQGVGPDSGADGDEDEIYWTLGPCPTHNHRTMTDDLGAIRTRDLMTKALFHALPIYQDYLRPHEMEHIMDFGLPASPGESRSLVFVRDRGSPDFSERDRSVIELLRPHLASIEKHVRLRQDLNAARMDSQTNRTGSAENPLSAILTNREREIVDLVAVGQTNAEIAATLWVAPSTVKKHLENIYAKTGIGRRAAVAAMGHSAGAFR